MGSRRDFSRRLLDHERPSIVQSVRSQDAQSVSHSGGYWVEHKKLQPSQSLSCVDSVLVQFLQEFNEFFPENPSRDDVCDRAAESGSLLPGPRSSALAGELEAVSRRCDGKHEIAEGNGVVADNGKARDRDESD
jgi:hypothetical protein